MKTPRFLRRARLAARSRRGAVAIEFGIIGTLFCMLLLGAIEVGRYYYTYQAVRTVVAEAARAAQVNTTLSGCQSGGNIASDVLNRTALNSTGLTVCFTRNTANSVTTVLVNASYGFNFAVPFLGNRARTLSENTRVVY